MSVLFYIAALLVARRLQQILKLSPLMVKWRTTLSFAFWLALGAWLVAEAFLNRFGQMLSGSLFLAAYIAAAYREPDFSQLRLFFRSNLPLIALGTIAALVMLVAPDWYDDHNSYFELPIVGAFVLTLAVWVNNKKQQQEFSLIAQQNKVLDQLVAERTAELTKQKNELQETLVLLQNTQQQLIQSEKLASLGELTAGIAHEIQNPLNFVNNFSEVSMELIEEMKEELDKGDTEEVAAIAGDLKQNLEKIIHHGKRADSIVKGMLQHSRASTGVKEPVDINALADEYLRLAYHGLRAKDKSFNAELVTHFDNSAPKINIVPQDVGRVLLNLFTNAFYAVQHRQPYGGAAYKPVVEVSTLKGDGEVIIKVRDNGTGIPDKVKDKIMQPFFTTKPTGEGTGLGLSMSYDIIVKGHGGNIDVTSKENEYTEFTITLPA